MGSLAVVKAVGKEPGQTLTVTDATALTIPNGENAFFITASGVATLPSLSSRHQPGRVIKLVGANGTGIITVTDTAEASAAQGTISLSGGNLPLDDSDTLVLQQRTSGGWFQVEYTAFG